MSNKVLLAYASYNGSTGEIANEIARGLLECGLQVDVVRMREVRVISNYDAVILGTSIRRERPLPEALDFVRQYRAHLRHIPIAVFSVGVNMRRDTSENREKTMEYLKPILQELNDPVDVGLFAGKIDTGELSMWWRMLAPKDQNGDIKEGDWRDWDKISNWSCALADELIG